MDEMKNDSLNEKNSAEDQIKMTDEKDKPDKKDADKLNADKSEKKRVNWKIAGLAAAGVVFAGGIGVSIAMSAMSNQQMNQMMEQMTVQNTAVNAFIEEQRALQAKAEEQTNEYQEDGFKVMEQYEIRSTTQISDAYLNNDPSGLSAEDKETYDMAVEILQQIIKDNMSVYEKELAIYEWMLDNIGQGSGHVISMPGQTTENYTPHDVLKNRTAVCVGYATTFRMFANMVGLDVHIVHNDYHSWDMVQLDDGEWYQLDIYSDHSGGARYRNFNMTDAVARNGHDWDGSALPEAKGVKYSYATQNAVAVKDLYEIPAKVKEAIDQKQSTLYFKFAKKLSDDDMNLADVMMGLFTQAICSLPEGASKDISGAWLPDENDSYILAVYINDYTAGASSDVKPEDSQKMTEIINQAFGVELMDPNAVPVVEDGMNGVVDIGIDEMGNKIKIAPDGAEKNAAVQDGIAAAGDIAVDDVAKVITRD